jgi:FtsP/CotA-like multicopper oxidase with cupredoxin domain
MKAQLTSPMFWLDEWRGQEFEGVTDFRLELTNVGLQMRPDLIDAHTLHFHGFRNAIPIFDGEPHSSVGVPISRNLTYFYRARDPGTYMYHCHFEETEHVHMGMVGGVFVRPRQNFSAGGFPVVPPARLGDSTDPTAPMGYVYNDGDGSTAYDREFVFVLNEVWTLAHWADSHVQLPEWSDYNPDIYLMNGRVYPDTIAPNGGYLDYTTGQLHLWDPDPTTGDMVHTERPELRYQPVSSLVTCNAGDRVLLRFINLGYVAQSMRLTGIKMRVVGQDATLLRGRDGKDLTYLTDSVHIGAGQSVDAIVDVPEDITEFTKLLLFSRNLAHLSNPGSPGLGGPMTEFHVYPADMPLAPQIAANDWGGA